MIRRPAQIASVATIAVSAVFLLIRLESHRQNAVALPAPVPVSASDALPNARVPEELAASPQASPSPAWTVAFEKNDDKKGTREIWTVHPGNGEPSLLLKDGGEPCWSPDHKQVAFERAGNVWVAQADGRAPRQLTFWTANQTTSAGESIDIDGISWNKQGDFLSFGRTEPFSIVLPDGRTKSFLETTIFHASLTNTGDRMSSRYPFHQPAHLIPSDWNDSKGYSTERFPPSFDATEDRTRYRFSDSEAPAWSLDGRRMAFVRNGDIWIADGSRQAGPDDAAQWEVKRIAACAEYDGTTGCGDHWTVVGTGISWSPDGSFLVYSASRITGSGQEDMHILTRREKKAGDEDDPKPAYNDTTLPLYGRNPSISPDGKWIVYSGSPIASMNTGENDPMNGIWAVTRDGKQCVSIARGFYGHPVW